MSAQQLLSLEQLSRTVQPPVSVRALRAWCDAGLLTHFVIHGGRRVCPAEAVSELQQIVQRARANRAAGEQT